LIQCGGQPVLPVSLKDEMGVDTVKIFCPKCSQVFHPPPIRSSRSRSHLNSIKNSSIVNNTLSVLSVGGGGVISTGVGTPSTIQSGGVDGAAFGTTFPHLFLMTFSNLVPDPLPVESVYVPRIFGFRLHKSTFQSQQQRFLPPSTTNATDAQPAVSLLQQQQALVLTKNNVRESGQMMSNDVVYRNISSRNSTNPTGDNHNDVDDDNNSQSRDVTAASLLSTTGTAIAMPAVALDVPQQIDEDINAMTKPDRDVDDSFLTDVASNKRRRRTSNNFT
jgi:Casein kinase II regulatory subunit